MPNEFLSTAIESALEAGHFLRRHFGTEIKIEEKFSYDLKIELDKLAQQKIIESILRDYPGHKVLGEEGTSGPPDAEVCWIVDPLDGTVNFTYGIPHFCISIAVQKQGKTVAGVIYDPIREELFTVSEPGLPKLNGKVIQSSPRAYLSEAVGVIGFSRTKETIAKATELFFNLVPKVRKIRFTGSAALDLAYVACGRLDFYIEQQIQLWDIAAGVLLVEKSGGKITTKPIVEGRTFCLKATNGVLDLDFITFD
ncbi:inositol monophosphatase [Candidatus Methylacidiphilum infernorum]|uniref:Inositol-1-monophosphatase n=1 Tax=Candidatus Methylacidiphilum infernorum TaxID=511746 RepID=A0ABX7PYM3_9BACT|nr:inositol monophosphatase family protein [Candidatus Methylacidiphilum infernorum]QSR87669.1 inositol monophosphatase [Candidatus Methylacidiphilum infernorum]